MEEILDILIGLHRDQGLAIIVVEQNLDFIRRLSERVLLIEKGTITGEVLPEALGHSKALGSLRRRSNDDALLPGRAKLRCGR